jgi:hypothetical protein
MKLEDSLKIDIIDNQPPPTMPVKPEVKEEKEELLRDVPLEDDDDEDIIPDLPEFVPKPKPSKDEIFDEDTDNISMSIEEPKEAPQVKKVKEDLLPEPVVPKKQRKKRKPMSEEHLAKLALAREKALAKRQFLAEERRLKREQEKLIKDQEEVLAQRETQKQLDALQRKLKKTKVKKKVVESSSEEEEEEPPPRSAKKDKQPVPSHFTVEDLQNAQLNAIMGYEMVRKKRKEEKKKNQQVNRQKKEIMETIAQAKPSWYIDDSPFNGLF